MLKLLHTNLRNKQLLQRSFMMQITDNAAKKTNSNVVSISIILSPPLIKANDMPNSLNTIYAMVCSTASDARGLTNDD